MFDKIKTAIGGYFPNTYEAITNKDKYNTSYNLTILHNAIINEDLNIIKKLLKKNCINTQDIQGKTPIFYSVFQENDSITELLIKSGGNPNIPDINGRTPLFYASDEKTIKILLNNGANINFKTKEGATPLFHSVTNVNKTLFKELLRANANTDICLNSGATLCDCLQNKGNLELIQIFEAIKGIKFDRIKSKNIQAPSFIAEKLESNIVNILFNKTICDDVDIKKEVKKIYFDLDKSASNEIKILLKCVGKICLEKDFWIVVNEKNAEPNIANLVLADKKREEDTYTRGLFDKNENCIKIFCPLKYDGSLKKNLFTRVLLHELTHAVIHYSNLNLDGNELSNAINKTKNLLRNKIILSKSMNKEDDKAKSQVIGEFINKIRSQYYRSSSYINEEMLASTLPIYHYIQKHSERKNILDSYLKPMFDYLENNFTDKINDYVEFENCSNIKVHAIIDNSIGKSYFTRNHNRKEIRNILKSNQKLTAVNYIDIKPGKSYPINSIFKNFTYCENPEISKPILDKAYNNLSSYEDKRLKLILKCLALTMLEKNGVSGSGLEIYAAEYKSIDKLSLLPIKSGYLLKGRYFRNSNAIYISNPENPADIEGYILHEGMHKLFRDVVLKDKYYKYPELTIKALKKLPKLKNNINANINNSSSQYIKEIILDRISDCKKSSYKNLYIAPEEIIADIGRVLLYGNQHLEEKDSMMKISKPLIDFFDNNFAPALEKYLCNHTKRFKLDSEIKIPNQMQYANYYTLKNHFYC